MAVQSTPASEHVPWYSREASKYALALIGYIVLGFFTKKYLTFTWGLMYYLLVLEVIPRTYRRAKAWLAQDGEAAS